MNAPFARDSSNSSDILVSAVMSIKKKKNKRKEESERKEVQVISFAIIILLIQSFCVLNSRTMLHFEFNRNLKEKIGQQNKSIFY